MAVGAEAGALRVPQHRACGFVALVLVPLSAFVLLALVLVLASCSLQPEPARLALAFLVLALALALAFVSAARGHFFPLLRHPQLDSSVQ